MGAGDNSTVSRHLCLENMSSRGLSLVALVLISVFCTGASSAADIPLAGYGVNGLEWRAQIDPVMGGNSDGTFSPANGIGILDGYVAKLNSGLPGFIRASTQLTDFPDITTCSAISLEVKSTTAYDGYRLQFGNKQAPECSHYSKGFKAHFVVNFTLPSESSSEFQTVVIPLTEFTNCNSDSTGEPITQCSADEQYCPDAATLRNMQMISIWAEGVEGAVHLETHSITATGCSANATTDHTETDEAEDNSTEATEESEESEGGDQHEGGEIVRAKYKQSASGAILGIVLLVASLVATGWFFKRVGDAPSIDSSEL